VVNSERLFDSVWGEDVCFADRGCGVVDLVEFEEGGGESRAGPYPGNTGHFS
jgi:hypothetical protein